jgi:glycosyltransferase involved in cell wall biosynthesis
MSGKERTLSVVIPVWNGERYLAETVESVLRQGVPATEVIVVDDGSTDRSGEVAASFGPPVRVVRQERGGVAAARNRGVEIAQGEFLAFLDADDLWLPEKTRLQFAALDADPKLDMSFGSVRQFHSPEISPELKKSLKGDGDVLPGIYAGTMVIRRMTFERVGPFETAWRAGEFIDWYAKAMELGLKSAVLPEIATLRRLHENNMGRRERASRSDFVRILKASFDRRRKPT